MAFGPKKKHSKSRTRTRTSNWIKLSAIKLENRVALNKDANGLSHHIAEDGTYKGNQLLKIKTKSKKVTRV
ncbi:50S ribosomal protein L32 [Candidatus Gracilibacteria bacterium]|nr:MAG: 50S ribosomal protein L32 [Candidatus Gracilibacteria bacterium]